MPLKSVGVESPVVSALTGTMRFPMSDANPDTTKSERNTTDRALLFSIF
ncbi:MAG: hypothetical protein KAU48_07420 [Candidatus Thorarchaeota archaeon]|nr:hypothetical protein [Candidatus Thorarchaeota archaeon]